MRRCRQRRFRTMLKISWRRRSTSSTARTCAGSPRRSPSAERIYCRRYSHKLSTDSMSSLREPSMHLSIICSDILNSTERGMEPWLNALWKNCVVKMKAAGGLPRNQPSVRYRSEKECGTVSRMKLKRKRPSHFSWGFPDAGRFMVAAHNLIYLKVSSRNGDWYCGTYIMARLWNLPRLVCHTLLTIDRIAGKAQST